MQAVAGGDTVAAGILDYAARELAQLAIQLLPFFGVDERKIVDVATTGGMLQEGSLLRRMLFAKLQEDPQMRMVERPIDPPAGALVLARAVEVR